MSLGFGGPTFLKSLRYYVAAEATFADGENNTIEPRHEYKLTSWLKARERMSHSMNLQGKVTWNQSPFKISGDVILQRSRSDQFFHNWNINWLHPTSVTDRSSAILHLQYTPTYLY